MFWLKPKKLAMPSPDEALPGRDEPIETAKKHHLLGTALKGPYPENMEKVLLGLGCFWGAETAFWLLEGVHVTAVGYAGGYTPNATYEEVCSGGTGHNEVVLVVYDPAIISLEKILKVYWENHNPTLHMRQGNDVGTQYRSEIGVYSDAQVEIAEKSRALYQKALHEKGMGDITTKIIKAPELYFAEGYHQQYLAKNPGGYCSLVGTGVCFPED